MYIVTVIPLAKGLLKENFSYFSSVEISLGSIVSVPIRSKNVDALVVNIKDARDLKSDLKRADYQLKKIEKIKGELPFMKDFFRACARMRNYTVGSTGTIIRNLIPSLFL